MIFDFDIRHASSPGLCLDHVGRSSFTVAGWTSISRRWRTRATRCITVKALQVQTKVDALRVITLRSN